MERPNLIFIFADQMRGMAMRCAGDPNAITPNMDRMAENGVIFTHAYANCPVCTPSRACILTGRYPLRNRAVTNDIPMPEDEITFGEILKQNGYHTGYVGKWHLDGVPRDIFTPKGKRRHGFDLWAVWNCAHDYFNGKLYFDDPIPIQLEGYEPIAQTDVAIEFIKAHSEDPFCLFLSWGPPHDPYSQVPNKYRELYEPDRLILRPNVNMDVDISNLPVMKTDYEYGTRRMLADYYSAITALDEQLGRIIDVVQNLGLFEKTIIVFTSDHGDMLLSQGSVKKQQPYEESINIPLIVCWKDHIVEGSTADVLFSTVDFLPTLLSLMGVECPSDVDGHDLSWAMLGETGYEPRSVFLTDLVPMDEGIRLGINEWRGVRTKRYTYARWLNGEGWVLYDNLADPYQLNNMIHDKLAEPLKHELEEELQLWMKTTDDNTKDWKELIVQLGLVDLWNLREKMMHPNAPRLIDVSCIDNR